MTTQQNARPITALLGTKLGMTQVWDENNKLVPVTVVRPGPASSPRSAPPTRTATPPSRSAYGAIDPRKVNKPLAGHFEKAGVTPRRHLVELRTDDATEYTLGQELGADVFEAGQLVDVTGTTKGKGFAGVMKRHGFHGVGASHGAHRNHRKPGSIGACATPSPRVQGHEDGRPDGPRAARPRRTSPCTRSTPRRACC